jgi:hypothetical protein
MSEKPTVIDAASVPTTSPSVQNVPVKINTTQMEKVIKEMAAKSMTATTLPGVQTGQGAGAEPVERINPSVFIRDMSADMERLYQRFETLKVLAAEINGRATNEPLPPQVIFRGLTLDFAISKDDKVTEHSVKMQALSCIGDISNLMSNEFGYIIAALRELSQQVADLAQKTNERCTAAFKDWEASNKDKQIVGATKTATISAVTTDAAPPSSAPESITLQQQ